MKTNKTLLQASVFFPMFLGIAVAHPAMDLTQVHFPPRATELQLPALSKMDQLSYENISSIYTRVLEVEQTITALKNQLAVSRKISLVPPSHHHCFINERNLSNFSHHNITQNLICNQHLLVLLSLALQRAAAYERCYYIYSGYSSIMLRAKGNLEKISQALSNITRVNYTDLVNGTCGLPSLSSLSAPVQGGMRCLNNNSRHNSRSVDDGNSLHATTESVTPRTESLENNVDPTDLDLLNQLESNNSTQDTDTHTSATSSICMSISSSEDQFIYIYEVWLGLYYVQVDLAQKRMCLQH